MQMKMKVGLSGPLMSLSPGDTPHFNETEAQSLVDAGFAEPVPSETAEERIARLEAELAEAKAALKPAPVAPATETNAKALETPSEPAAPTEPAAPAKPAPAKRPAKKA